MDFIKKISWVNVIKNIILVILSAMTFFLVLHEYVKHEEFVDNETLEIETKVSNAQTVIIKSSTTTIPILVYLKIGKQGYFLLKGSFFNKKISVDDYFLNHRHATL